ncbi:nucleotidyltransferase domain-containing protein [Candidatus Woesearchaeota archaeon]|nr:nucleotidyltransferase domain-containing protein [Candidatus Woesearchaeota archaeon]
MFPFAKELQKNKNILAAYLFGSQGTSRQTPLSGIDISVFDVLPPAVQVKVFRGKPLFIVIVNYFRTFVHNY